MKKLIKLGICLIVCIILFIIIALLINRYVKTSTQAQILTENDYTKLENIDCIVVLGEGIWGDKPSHMLEDRLLQGIELYDKDIVPKILMSGDHGRVEYDEVNLMKEFAIDKGVKSKDVFMDHAGFSTYETMYRARDIFKADKVIIVTQKYHLFRALHIAEKLGIEAYGVGSDPRKYHGATYREIREVLARNKDFIKGIIKPEPTYLGDAIPISGDGDKTNDKIKDKEALEKKENDKDKEKNQDKEDKEDKDKEKDEDKEDKKDGDKEKEQNKKDDEEEKE